MKYKIPIPEDNEEEITEELVSEKTKELIKFISVVCDELIDEICKFSNENDYDANGVLDVIIDTLDLFADQVDLDYYEIDEDGEGFFEIPEGNGMLN